MYNVKFGPFCIGWIPGTIKCSTYRKEVIVSDLSLVHEFKKQAQGEVVNFLLFVLENRVCRVYRQHLPVQMFYSWVRNTRIEIYSTCSFPVYSKWCFFISFSLVFSIVFNWSLAELSRVQEV